MAEQAQPFQMRMGNETRKALQQRADHTGRSMAEEARRIIDAALGVSHETIRGGGKRPKRAA